MAFPEIPPGLPFPKGGEFIYGNSMNLEAFPPLKRGNKGDLTAFQMAKSSQNYIFGASCQSRKNKGRKGFFASRPGRRERIASSKYFKIFLFFPKRKIYPRANGGILPLRGSFARIVLSPCRILRVKTFIAHEERGGTALYGPGKLNRGGLRQPILLTGWRKTR